MDNQRIAKILVWIIFLVIFCMINEFSEWYKEKKMRNPIISILVSTLTFLLVTAVSSLVAEPFTYFIKEAKETSEKKMEEFIEQVPLPQKEDEAHNTDGSRAEQEADQSAEEDSRPDETANSDSVVRIQQEENLLQYHPAIPVANRALVPEGSQYPDITMEAVSLYDSRSAQNYGYQGVTRSNDSVTYAFTASTEDSEGLFHELEEEILKNPYVGHMIIQGLQKEYPDFAKEPILTEFAKKCEAAFELPEGTEKRGIAFWYEAYRFPDNKTAVYVTDDYRNYAEALCQTLRNFTNLGVRNFEFRACYVSNLGVGYESAQTQALNEAGSLSALVLYHTNSQGEVVCVIGFDLNDKGLMIYDTDVIS